VPRSPASQAFAYAIAYNVRVLTDLAKPVNNKLQLELQLCDANGLNASAASIAVTLVAVDGTSRTGSFTYDFQLDKKTGGYAYDLDTKGLAPGSHTLTFQAAGDPTLHTVTFRVR
jgi:hypothetical protein